VPSATSTVVPLAMVTPLNVLKALAVTIVPSPPSVPPMISALIRSIVPVVASI